MSELPPEALLQRRRPRPVLWALGWVVIYLVPTAVQFVCEWIPYIEGSSLSNVSTWVIQADLIGMSRFFVFGVGLAFAAPVLALRIFTATASRRRLAYAITLAPLLLYWVGEKPVRMVVDRHKLSAFHNAIRDAEQVVRAIRKYRADRGNPPASLGELVPAYIVALPKPRFPAQWPSDYAVEIDAGRPSRWAFTLAMSDSFCSGGRYARFRESSPLLTREGRDKDGLLAGWVIGCD